MAQLSRAAKSVRRLATAMPAPFTPMSAGRNHGRAAPVHTLGPAPIRGGLAPGRADRFFGIPPPPPRPHRMSRMRRISFSLYGWVLMMSRRSSRSMGMPWGAR